MSFHAANDCVFCLMEPKWPSDLAVDNQLLFLAYYVLYLKCVNCAILLFVVCSEFGLWCAFYWIQCDSMRFMLFCATACCDKTFLCSEAVHILASRFPTLKSRFWSRSWRLCWRNTGRLLYLSGHVYFSSREIVYWFALVTFKHYLIFNLLLPYYNFQEYKIALGALMSCAAPNITFYNYFPPRVRSLKLRNKIKCHAN